MTVSQNYFIPGTDRLEYAPYAEDTEYLIGIKFRRGRIRGTKFRQGVTAALYKLGGCGGKIYDSLPKLLQPGTGVWSMPRMRRIRSI